jgi:hypothetical protein
VDSRARHVLGHGHTVEANLAGADRGHQPDELEGVIPSQIHTDATLRVLAGDDERALQRRGQVEALLIDVGRAQPVKAPAATSGTRAIRRAHRSQA